MGRDGSHESHCWQEIAWELPLLSRFCLRFARHVSQAPPSHQQAIRLFFTERFGVGVPVALDGGKPPIRGPSVAERQVCEPPAQGIAPPLVATGPKAICFTVAECRHGVRVASLGKCLLRGVERPCTSGERGEAQQDGPEVDASHVLPFVPGGGEVARV